MAPPSRKKTAFFLITALLFLALQLSLLRTFPLTDEAQFLTTARLLNSGKMPYRDFSDIHPPGLTYMVAFAFRLFGESYFSARLMMVLVSIATAFALYLIGSRIFNETAGMAAYLMFGIYAPVMHNFLVFTHPFIALLSAIAIILFMDYFETESRPKLFLAGVLLGMAWLFRQNALWSFFGFFAALVLFRTFLGKSKKRLALDSALFVAGAVLPAALYLAYLSAHGALPDFADEIFGLDYARYARNTLARYPLFDLKIQLVSLFSFVFIPLFVMRANKKSPIHALLISLAAFSMFYLYPNFGYPIFITLLIPGALCAGWFFSGGFGRHKAMAVVLALGILAVSAYFYYHRAFKDEFSGNNEFGNYNFYEIPDYIRSRTKPGDTIYGFSGTVNYFLTGRNPASKYWYPRYYETKMEQRQLRIIGDLEQNNPKYVAYVPNQHTDYEKVADYAPIVNDYILKNYRIEKEFSSPMGTLWLMVPKS